MYRVYPHKRYNMTEAFMAKHLPVPCKILDLGVDNPLSQRLRALGYQVQNTSGQDLDLNPAEAHQTGFDAVTGFEILEHLINPMGVLRDIQSNKLMVSIPLRLWFSAAYRSKTDPWDRHYHEFEDWQFDWLLEKSGWTIVDRLYGTHPVKKVGIRPLLRLFTPRYYWVYAVRNTELNP